jgi:c-di-GMP-binding flagellar brake protein YcgR
MVEENHMGFSQNPGEERRKYKRFPFVFPIKYTYLGKSPDASRASEFSLYSFSNNISRGGMMLTITNNIPPGEYIDLIITLPVEHEVISIHAVSLVKWIQKEEEGFLAGIEFARIRDEDLTVIQRFLETDSF